MPRIACVLINYRNVEDTLACLRSLKASGAGAWRIILVDNDGEGGGRGASDGSLERELRGLGLDHEYLFPGENLGFTGAVNLGAKAALEAGCGHVMLLNNDTLVAEDFAARVDAAVAAHPGDVIAGKVLEHATGEPSWNIGTVSPLTGQVRHIFAAEYAGHVDFVSGCLMIIPADVIRRLGLFDDRYFMYCEDYDFCLRLRAAGVAVRYVPAILIRHKSSSSTTRSKTPKEYYRIRNMTHIVLNRARPAQKFVYLGFLMCMMPYKLVRRPHLFAQAMRGALDGLSGRLGRRH
jgi:GT2 family glycosyltransferase